MPDPRPLRRHTGCTRPPRAPRRQNTAVADAVPAQARAVTGHSGRLAAADVDDREGIHYERVGVLDRPEPACVPETGSDLPAYRREQARRRCTTLLRCLCGVAISTGLIGLFPGLHLAWIFTGLCGRGRPRAGRPDGVREGDRGPTAARRRARLTTPTHQPGDPSSPPPPVIPARGTTKTRFGARPPPSDRPCGRTRCRSEGRPGPDYPGCCRGCSSAGRALRSQCRGRGFESLHLHQRPRSEGQGGIPRRSHSPTCLYVSLSRQSGSPGTDEFGTSRGRVRDCRTGLVCLDRRHSHVTELLQLWLGQ